MLILFPALHTYAKYSFVLYTLYIIRDFLVFLKKNAYVNMEFVFFKKMFPAFYELLYPTNLEQRRLLLTKWTV